MSKSPARGHRWQTATGEARKQYDIAKKKYDEAQEAFESFRDHLADLEAIKEEYEEWQGNLPENMASSTVAEMLEAITSLDFDLGQELSDIESYGDLLDECESADLPMGFGRD